MSQEGLYFADKLGQRMNRHSQRHRVSGLAQNTYNLLGFSIDDDAATCPLYAKSPMMGRYGAVN